MDCVRGTPLRPEIPTPPTPLAQPRIDAVTTKPPRALSVKRASHSSGHAGNTRITESPPGPPGALCSSALQRIRRPAEPLGVERLRTFAQRHPVGQDAARDRRWRARRSGRASDSGQETAPRPRGPAWRRRPPSSRARRPCRGADAGGRLGRRSRSRASACPATPGCRDRRTTSAGCCRPA